MKAIVVHEFGGPEVMKLEEFPAPKAGAGQVVVRVRAAGVNPFDTYMRAGTYAIKPLLPYVPGGECAGMVDSIGEGVKSVKPGDRVYVGHPSNGTYAEYTLAEEGQVFRLPERVTFQQGAGVYVACGTAYHALYDQASAHASETLLVHGASGGVGTATVQMAKAMGLTVFGTAGSEKGLALVQREGADEVFDHTKPTYLDQIVKATGGKGVDIVLEMLANVNLANDTRLIGQRGRVIVIGNRGEVTINARELMGRRASICGFTLWGISPQEEAEIHAGICAGMENGTLRPIIGKEFPLEEATRAHLDILEPGAAGKIVLIP